MSETDGIEEAFEGQLRILVTAAGQAGERFAREREAVLRTAQARSEQEQRELASRFQAEREAARVQLSRVHENQWWDNALPPDISQAWQTATAWSAEDPEAARAQLRIGQELEARYGITPEQLRADVRAQRHRAATERAEAQRLMAQADRDERAATDGCLPAEQSSQDRQRESVGAEARGTSQYFYDSAERRASMADDLKASGIAPDVVDARTRADASQAYPATQAVVKDTKRRTPKARKNRGRSSHQAQRAGLGR